MSNDASVVETEAEGRDEPLVMSAAGVLVELGGRKFEIIPQPIRRSRKFRAHLGRLTPQIVDAIEAFETAFKKGSEPESIAAGEFLRHLELLLVQAPDQLIEAIFVYSPELEADKEWIEDHASDQDCMAALFVILRLVYVPFVSAFVQIREMMPGTNAPS